MRREFPSLSGGPRAQNSSPMSMAWNSNTLRQTQPPSQQQTPAPRQNMQNDIARPQPPGSLGFGTNIEDSFDNRVAATARAENNQAQLGGGDDFPPLGGVGAMNGDRGHDNRPGGVLSMGGLGAGPFGANGQLDNESYSNPATDGELAFDYSRGNFAQSFLTYGLGITSPLGSHRTTSNPTALNQQLPFRDHAISSQRQPPIGQAHAPQQPQTGSEFDVQNADSPSSPQQHAQARRRLSELTDNDKWGLQGLLAQLPNRSEGEPGIVMGQDLNTLGVDFDSAEPLFPTFSTPFADATSRSAIPDFTLPIAYTVSNVPPLHVRINTFSDETLFAIFYQYTRDVMQEIAAAELYTRDWRWHKELRQWMMKDGTMAQPIRITERSERGVYLFFDAINWRRERVSPNLYLCCTWRTLTDCL